jgi:peptidoglycan/LPS O-acetylase OafA/YrhL
VAVSGNNFNLLRLAFAMMVVAYHLVLLSDVGSWAGAIPVLSELAEVGVQGFFVLSGYLVYASLERSTSVRVYAEKRFRRLYPAYAVVIVVCAAAGLAASPEARADLAGVGRYLGANLVFANFIEPNLPGVFAGSFNATTEVNGALWTLKIEVMFYLVLPLLAWLLRKAGPARWALLAAIYIGAEAWRFGLESAGHVELSRQLPGQMSFFVTGIALYHLQLRGVPMHLVGLMGAVLLALTFIWQEASPARALGLGCLAVWAAIAAPRLPDAARFGDLSYGLYIVHFPIIQTLLALGVFAANPWAALVTAVVASIVAALLLWRLVEKPSLRPDSAYRAARA